MSPRAAWRLESFGFTDVYDYVAGKSDWRAAGLPTEGPASTTPRPGALARRDVATCRPNETIAAARTRVRASQWDRCVVVNDAQVVMGMLDQPALGSDDELTAETVMRVGPATVRADEDLPGLLHRMHARRVASMLVTDPEGRLLGVLMRDDADRVQPAHSWDEDGPA